jgi:uncharacterized protein (DUF3084 family)
MTSAYILIVAMVLLGGLLAAIGDRLGSRIGKKRMRLFNLRPKQTATLMTIVTGALIAGSTLTLLFASSKSLRQGVFELDRLLDERRSAIKDLESKVRETTAQKEKVEKELEAARKAQVNARKRLGSLNKNYQASREQLRIVSARVARFQKDVRTLTGERLTLSQQREQLIGQRDRLAKQRSLLASQIAGLQTSVEERDRELINRNRQLEDQQRLLTQRQARLRQLENEQKSLQVEIDRRDARINELDRSIVGKNLALEQTEGRLKELENQISFLRREVEVLEQYYQTYQELREKQIAIVRGQVLSFGAFRVVDPAAIVGAIDRLLREANNAAIRATRPNKPNPDERVVKITKAQVEQLAQQLQDGREYVVRILSAGNYVLGENEVRVFADVVPNQKVLSGDQVLAAVSLDPREMTEEDIQQRLDLLIASAQFRARSAGVLGGIQVEDGLLTTIVNFIDRLKKSGESIDTIQAVVEGDTLTAGPLKIRLVAIRDGAIVFNSSS